MLPKEAIEEFKKLYLARFGVELDDNEASRRANNLVNLFKFVYDEPAFGPMDTKANPQYENKNEENDSEK